MTDPIQHLRELMAKSPHRPWRLRVSPSLMKWAIDGTRRPVIDGDFAGDWPVDRQEQELRMIVALVNLAPQLLEVAMRARRACQYDWSGNDGDAVADMAALHMALAALGGKGGGG